MKEFIISNIVPIISVTCSILIALLGIFSKKCPKLTDFVENLTFALVGAEALTGADVKKEFAMRYLKKLYKNVDTSVLSDAIELILTTPQKKGEINEKKSS